MKTTENYRVRLVSGKELTIKADEAKYDGDRLVFAEHNIRVAEFQIRSLEGYWLEKNAGESAES